MYSNIVLAFYNLHTCQNVKPLKGVFEKLSNMTAHAFFPQEMMYCRP